MIALTKLDGSPVIVNLEAIKYIESIPDTLILFVNGDSMLVKEALAEVEAKVIALKANILRESR